jgi:hypothetical protein
MDLTMAAAQLLPLVTFYLAMARRNMLANAPPTDGLSISWLDHRFALGALWSMLSVSFRDGPLVSARELHLSGDTSGRCH